VQDRGMRVRVMVMMAELAVLRHRSACLIR
jgi:hypothetical protein